MQFNVAYYICIQYIISIYIHILVKIKQQLQFICILCNIYCLNTVLLFNNSKLVYKINIIINIYQN